MDAPTLKADLEKIKVIVEAIETLLPGSAVSVQSTDAISAVLENPLVLQILVLLINQIAPAPAPTPAPAPVTSTTLEKIGSPS